jgi:hypothetical protein
VIRDGGQAQRPAPTNGFLEDDLPCTGLFLKLTAATNQPLIQNETSEGAGFHACPKLQIIHYVETGRHRGLPLRLDFEDLPRKRTRIPLPREGAAASPYCRPYLLPAGTCRTLTENGGNVTFIRLPVIGNVVSRATSLVGFSNELSSLSALA